jgi:hypothetical protein
MLVARNFDQRNRKQAIIIQAGEQVRRQRPVSLLQFGSDLAQNVRRQILFCGCPLLVGHLIQAGTAAVLPEIFAGGDKYYRLVERRELGLAANWARPGCRQAPVAVGAAAVVHQFQSRV